MKLSCRLRVRRIRCPGLTLQVKVFDLTKQHIRAHVATADSNFRIYGLFDSLRRTVLRTYVLQNYHTLGIRCRSVGGCWSIVPIASFVIQFYYANGSRISVNPAVSDSRREDEREKFRVVRSHINQLSFGHTLMPATRSSSVHKILAYFTRTCNDCHSTILQQSIRAAGFPQSEWRFVIR